MKFTEIAVADASIEAKVEAISVVLDKKLESLTDNVVSVSQQVGPKGERGERGPAGKDGKDGKDGRDGIDGRNGSDGRDGEDGKDGVGVADAYLDFDGSLVIKLTNGKELNAGEIEGAQNKESVIQMLKNGALSLNELLPNQFGNNGKALFTDGTNAYWDVAGGGGSGAVDSVNGHTGTVVLTYADVGAASAAQGAKADTAVQPAAIANMLESHDIGVSVQGYNANTVVDASYIHTDNNYTTDDKNKLAGIAAGAEVNVNADWNATTGDAHILNKPTLGTAAAANTTDFATAAQGALADTAVQPSSSPTFTNLYVTGDLEVNGSLTTVTTQTLQVEDPIIYVASGASSINTLDQGLVGHFVSGTYQHTGLVRDHTDGKWKLFKGVTTEPTTVIDWSQAVYDTLKLGTLEVASINANGTTFDDTEVGNWNTAYGWGNHASAGYLTSYTETDPVFTASPAHGITNTNITNWNTAYGWGNHASAGYLTSATAATTYQPIGSYLTSSAIGSTVQAYDADLTSWAAITPSSKQDTLVSGTNIKTVNGNSLLGSGDVTISGSVTGFWAATVDKLTSTQASTSTTLANVTQLVEPLVANGVYKIDCFVTFQSAATTTGLNLGFTSPTGSICQLEVVVPITSTAAATQLRTTFPNTTSTNTGNVLGTGVTATNSNHTAKISGIVHCGGTAGNFQVQFATEVNGSAITLQIGSSLVVQRIA